MNKAKEKRNVCVCDYQQLKKNRKLKLISLNGSERLENECSGQSLAHLYFWKNTFLVYPLRQRHRSIFYKSPPPPHHPVLQLDPPLCQML